MNNNASSERIYFENLNISSQTNENKETKIFNLNEIMGVSDTKTSNTLKETSSKPIATTIESNKLVIFEDNRHESALKSMFLNEICESGVVNPSEEYCRNLYLQDRQSALNVMNCINKIFMDSFGLDNRQNNILVGILHMLSHFSYEEVYPLGQTMSLAALNHKNFEVCEYAIKCFENWGHKDSIDKLKNIQFATDWLQEYADDIVKELESR